MADPLCRVWYLNRTCSCELHADRSGYRDRRRQRGASRFSELSGGSASTARLSAPASGSAAGLPTNAPDIPSTRRRVGRCGLYRLYPSPQPELVQVIEVAARQRSSACFHLGKRLPDLPQPVFETPQRRPVGADRLLRGRLLALQAEKLVLDCLLQVHQKAPFLTDYHPVRMGAVFRLYLATLTAAKLDSAPPLNVREKAGDGTRTHDIQLGKLTFYH